MASLIGFDKNRLNAEYKGHAKLSINFVSNYLYVEPINEDFKLISASFKWNYVMSKNLLFVFAEFNFLDFCLAFKNEKICKNIYDYIASGKKKDTHVFESGSIDISFINPIFKEIADNLAFNSDLIEVIAQWHKILDEVEKEKYSNSMKEFGIFELIFNSLKHFQSKIRGHFNSFKTIASDPFQLISNSKLRKLLIFTSETKESFHQFNCLSKDDNEFYCISCGEPAIIDVNDRGDIFMKMKLKEHSCKLSTVFPENFMKITIICKHAYKVLQTDMNTCSGNLLINDDSNENYEYCYDQKTSCYVCHGCNKSTAKIMNKGTTKEYVEIVNQDHQCENQKFRPRQKRKFQQRQTWDIQRGKNQAIYDYVLKPNFEIQALCFNGKEGKRLIIFDQNDRTKCYSYFYVSKIKTFHCRQCYKKGKSVTAKLRQNYEDEEYVILSNAKHVCELQMYSTTKKQILHPPDFELMEETNNGKPRIFVFDKHDQKKCYTFYFSEKYYVCVGCHYRYSKKQNSYEKVVFGKLVKEENGNYSFQLNRNRVHSCKPTPYNPGKYQILPKTYDFFYFRPKKHPNSLKLAICLPENDKLCFEFLFHKTRNSFVCGKCNKLKKHSCIVAIRKDANDKEYFNHDIKKHVCKPIKVSSISPPNFVRLKEHGIIFKSKPKNVEIDESKILKKFNFELRPNSKGDPDKKLIHFHPTDQTLCYEYLFDRNQDIYKCSKCKKLQCHVYVKRHKNENNKTVFLMGSKEHVCEAIKYKPL